MASLSAGSKVVARDLLSWDRRRVADIERQGFDVTVYRARQDLASVCIDADVAAWPDEVRDLFMAVLEVSRTPSPALQHGVGRLRTPARRLSPTDVDAYRTLAEEIGVLRNLAEVSPLHWAPSAALKAGGILLDGPGTKGE